MIENILYKFAGAFIVFTTIGFLKYCWQKLFGKPESDEPEGFEDDE